MLKKHEGEKVGKHSTNALYSDPNRMWLPSPWEFRQRGESGLWVSDLFPHIAGVADEICVIRSMLGHLPLHGQQNQSMYGIGSQDEHQNYYAMQALRARRLVEAGVRFIEITCPSFDGNNSPWDQHGALKANHEKNARITEQSVAALIRDLKQRGLLDETLVVWAGEMGRTPHHPGKDGRDHHINGYSIFWPAAASAAA